VPNVVGDTQAAASSAITGAGLVVGTVTTTSSNTMPSGEVISQTPTAATLVNVGSAVNLVISTGPSQYLLTTIANPVGGGTISPPGGSYALNQVVTLTTTPAAGFVFAGWSGPVSSTTANPTKVTMSGAETVSANFVSQISVSPTSVNFGTVYLGSITTKTLTVTNNGSNSVSITNPLISLVSNGDSKEFVATNLCLLPLAPHASCPIEVTFIAGPYYQQQSATLSVKDNTSAPALSVSLTALTIDPQVQLNPASLNFGVQKVGVSAMKSVTLTNSGASSLTITAISLTGANATDFKQTNNCPNSLTAGSNCIISVTFTPSARGSRAASLVINDNTLFGQQSLPLAGDGD